MLVILLTLAFVVFLAVHLAGARDSMRRARWLADADAHDRWPTDDEETRHDPHW